MERASNKHGNRMDDALSAEVEDLTRSGHETRAEEWHSTEPSGEDQPDIDRAPDSTLTGGVPDGMTEADVAGRSELATTLGKEVWPANAQILLDKAEEMHAPDRVIDLLHRLPQGREYASVGEVWATLTGAHEEHRF
jgi:Protein of unknown function (DUF2795)